MITIHGQEQAERAARANMSPRYMRLESLETWVEGTQYKGRPNWWSDKVPLWEREPCIVYPVVNIAISSNVDLCLGEGRFPSFQVASSGADVEGDDETDPVEDCLRQYHTLSRFPAVCRDAYRAGQGCGTAVSVLGARNGRPFQELVPAKWCEREIDQDSNVSKLTIEYPYVEEFKQPDGTWAVRTMLYRRVIDDKRDVTYLPAKADENGLAPSWVEDKSKTVSHGLGFCPVIWYAFMRGCQAVNVVDGRAIHALLTDEIQAHDIARSQWHRTALMSEPQICEIGVTPGYNPTDSGRAALIPSTERDGPIGPTNPVKGYYKEDTGPKTARKKGPGQIWQYPTGTSVETITIPSDALKAQQDNCSDLRIKIQEGLAVVFLDPENIKFAATTSGKALEAIKQKQLNRIDEHREDFRDGFMVPSLIMQLKFIRHFGASLKVPMVKEALAALGSNEFSVPDIEVTWGDYFKPDPTEQAQIVTMTKDALKDTPLITQRLAVEKIAGIFGVKDIDKLMGELEAEDADRREKAGTELRRIMGEDGQTASRDPEDLQSRGDSRRPKDGEINAGVEGN